MKITKYEYFIVALFVVLCGFTSGYVIPAKTYFLGLMGILYLVKKKNRQSIYPLISLILAYIVIGIIQKVIYNNYSSRLFIDVPLLMLSGFYIMDKLGCRFRYAYMNVMTIIAGISIIFYVIMLISGYVPSLSIFERPNYKSIFIYNIRLNEIVNHRNCGPFWEPGAYSGYLLMIPILFFNNLKTLWTNYKRKCIILLIAFLTTFSAQGYIILGLLISFYYFKGRINIKTVTIGCFLIILSVLLYMKLDFLHEKVTEQLELTSDWDANDALLSANRFTTSMLDWYYIEKSPFIGNTDNPLVRYRDHPFIIEIIDRNGEYGSGSGITSFIAMYGVPLFSLWILLVYCSLRRLFTTLESIFVLLLFILLGLAEVYMNYIFYVSLPFLFLGYNQKRQVINRSYIQTL